jgi:hypothetical protein
LRAAQSGAELEVSCITRAIRKGSDDEVAFIGNRSQHWCVSREVAINRVSVRSEAYYMVDRTTGHRAYVGVQRQEGKPPRLRITSNGTWNDDLWTLARCDGNCKLLS